MGIWDNVFGQRTPEQPETSRSRPASVPQPATAPAEPTAARPQPGHNGPPPASGMDLPTVPLWIERIWGTQEASLTATGAQYVLAHAPQLAEDYDDRKKVDTLSVHLIDGAPWLSWRGVLIGKMHHEDRQEAVAALQQLDPLHWRLELPGLVGWQHERVYHWGEDGPGEETLGERIPVVYYAAIDWVTHDDRRDLTWFAQNPAPTGNVALLPDGGWLSVKLDDATHPVLQRYIRHGASCGLYATLRMGEPASSRSAPPCLVEVDGQEVGRLTPQSAKKLAPLLENLSTRGYEAATWAVLKGNTIAAELAVYPQRAHEVDEAWLIMPDSPRPGPNG